MKVFRIEKGNQNFITPGILLVSVALNNLAIGENIIIKIEEMDEEEYNRIPASVESAKFFGQQNSS